MQAITSAEEVTEQNISLMMNEATFTLPLKMDIDMEKSYLAGTIYPLIK